jgi:hypothetical protein
MKHGDVRFMITLNLKEGGELVNGSCWKKDMVKILARNKKINSKIFFMLYSWHPK